VQYGNGDFAPGVKYGEWGKWHCGHNLLLAHAKAVKVFRDGGYKAKNDGRIGMALWSEWSEPWSGTEGGEALHHQYTAPILGGGGPLVGYFCRWAVLPTLDEWLTHIS
jgi:hypothetical protein